MIAATQYSSGEDLQVRYFFKVYTSQKFIMTIRNKRLQIALVTYVIKRTLFARDSKALRQ